MNESPRAYSSSIRAYMLNKVNREINKVCTPHKALLSKLGRCYYIVILDDPDNIKVRVLSAEAPLDPTGRSLLCNKQLYGQNAYWGWVEYRENGRGHFKRQTKIKESVTYAEGQILFEFVVKGLGFEFTRKYIFQAFRYYRNS